MLRIRLARLGRKKRPHYRVVVAESRWARDGRRIAELGHYDPMTDPSTIVLDVARTDDWIRKGAQPSERVVKLLAIARAPRRRSGHRERDGDREAEGEIQGEGGR